MDEKRFGMESGKKDSYGPICGPYARYIDTYVRIVRNNGYTHVGRVVHAGPDGILLLPAVVSVTTRKGEKLMINKRKGMETFVPNEGCAIEPLFRDGRLGRAYLDQIVADCVVEVGDKK